MSRDPADHGRRDAALDLSPDAFRAAGHQLVDDIAAFLAGLADRPVTPPEPFTHVRDHIADRAVPASGEPLDAICRDAAALLFDHSVLTGHPRFWGYVNSAASPVAALAELLAAAVNPQVASWYVGPAASAIEQQTVRWIADLIDYPPGADGLIVSGGTDANLHALAAARRKVVGDRLRIDGVGESIHTLRVYATDQAHTWLDKTVSLMGHGSRAIRSIPTDSALRMDPAALSEQLARDRRAGELPWCVVATAGTTSTGAVDPLPAIADVCRDHGVWLHVDGAYGAFAALSPLAPPALRGLAAADSVALDPHKWLYTGYEAGCVLIREPRWLHAAFAHDSSFYRERDDEPVPYRELGLQTSRGFRALKVWMCLRVAGRDGYRQMITDDIELARYLHDRADAHPLLQALSHSLSVTTFRFVPQDLAFAAGADAYLDRLNAAVLAELQSSGVGYPSRCVAGGKFALRTCIVNFRTGRPDLDALVDAVAARGQALDRSMRPADV